MKNLRVGRPWSSRQRILGVIATGVLLARLIALAWRYTRPTAAVVAPLPLTLALPVQAASGAFFVAEQRQLFPQHGLVLQTQRYALGKQALAAVIEGRADMAVVADTPFVLAIAKGNQVAVVSTVFGSRKTAALLVRADRGMRTAADLRGRRIGTVFGTNAQYFLDKLLEHQGIAAHEVSIVDYAPAALLTAMRDGEVDAITTWQPELARLQQALGKKVAALFEQDLFVYRFLLVGKVEFIDSHQQEIQRLLAALADTQQYMLDQPLDARQTVAAAVGLPPELMSSFFEPVDYGLSLDQSLLLALDDQTRWARQRQIITNRAVPNYLDYLRPQPLQAVLPSAISIIR
ncbi:ABC transporter substrate-binding protein [Janthinobacterium sp. CAN_S1]|uniref:ABC transporter substrate-binding protein n=1 Tax=Janthinobacterium sp. CAN_S1 TaxID=2787725 RepID=UPI002FF113A4